MKKGTKFTYNGFGSDVGKVFEVINILEKDTVLEPMNKTGNQFKDAAFYIHTKDLIEGIEDGTYIEVKEGDN